MSKVCQHRKNFQRQVKLALMAQECSQYHSQIRKPFLTDFPELLSQDNQDCTPLKTQTRGNNVHAGLSSAKVRTADFTSWMLYAPALTPESPKHFQSFLPFLAAAPPLLLEERGRSRSGKLGWRLKRLQIHWLIQLYLSSPLIPNISTVSIYVRLSGWSSLYKTKR